MGECHVAWPYPTFSLFSVLKLSLSVRRFEFLHESIPMDSRSSYNEPAETDGTRRILKYEPSSVLFSSAALKTPFALPFLRPSRASHTAAGDALHIFKELQKSVALTAERCAEMLQSLVDANPVLNMFASLSSQSHDFCGQVRMHRKHSQNISFHTSNFAAILPGDSMAGMVVTNGILNFLNIYNTILVVRLVLTWFPNAPASIVSPLRYKLILSFLSSFAASIIFLLG
uniref:Uncharacterized protein n=1 Tax=Kalanchoe fedtschenkoi TaxID=63787 RepID=A0A7N1A6D4_KALFE